VSPENPCRWQEWLIPARILNEQGSVRQLRKDAQQLKAIEAATEGWDALVAAGLIIVARGSKGRLGYRNGKLVYKLSEKG
jgi:hypothetical protein